MFHPRVLTIFPGTRSCTALHWRLGARADKECTAVVFATQTRLRARVMAVYLPRVERRQASWKNFRALGSICGAPVSHEQYDCLSRMMARASPVLHSYQEWKG